MSLDGIVLRALTAEFAALVGGRINKIYQPTEHEVVLQLRAQTGNVRLLLSANPTYPRIHAVQSSFPNPAEPPMFCMLLRKHCEGGIIERVEQSGMERILHIDVRNRDELGDLSVKRIIVELMGRHSNIILTDPAAGIVLDGIHHITPAISSYRVVMPGSVYVLPPEQNKTDPLRVGRERFLDAVSAAASAEPSDPESLLVRSFSGLSPLVAREIVHRARRRAGDSGAAPEHDREALWAAFDEVIRPVAAGRFAPNTVEAPNGKTYFSVVELSHIDGERRTFPSASACLEAYYGDKAERDTVRQRTSDLLKFLQNERGKNVKKLEKLAETLEEARGADRYRILGELLNASLHLAQRGDSRIEVTNYYDEEQKPIAIELDTQLTPSENAQRYFKKYTKMKNSLEAVKGQIEAAGEEIRYLETLLAQLGNAGLADIAEIREELIEQGYIRDRSKKTAKKKKPDRPAIACYVSSEGVPIYVGKNNLQNEYVTNRLAQSSDTWLHTKDIPGSHVIIRAAEFGEATLHEAAQLAAYYSQARVSSSVPVDYTLIRHVRKPSGAKPGFVIYDHQRTLFVTPDEQRIKTMPVSVKS